MPKNGAGSKVAAFVIKLDRRRGVPLYVQITEAIRRAAETGKIRAGAALPSTRALALELGVSRNTVMQAYEDLSSQGLIHGQQRSRTEVGKARKAVPRAVHWRVLLERAGYANQSIGCSDPDGTPLYTFTSIVRRGTQARRKS